jgi:hypothetical protein
MLKSLSLVAALAVLPSVPAHAAQNLWIENGRAAPQDMSRASDGTFGIMLVLTDDWEGFTKRWQQTSPGFDIPAVGPIPKGHPIISAIIFRGCRTDQSGSCSLTGDFRAIDPNGKTYAEQKDVTIWNSPPPPAPQLELSAGGFGLSLDPPDPLGTYTIIARITDHVANKTLEVRTTFLAK